MSRGRLVYKIKYDTGPQKLMVTVERCEGLQKEKGIFGGKVDPYVRVFLMPGTHAELKTKVMKNNLNPTFNDEFSFVISPTDVLKKTIVFQAWDSDLGKDDPLGEVQVPLWTRSHQMEGFTSTEEMGPITNDNTGKNKPVLREKRPTERSSRSMSTISMESGRSSVSSMRETSSMQQSSQRRSVMEVNQAGGFYKPEPEAFSSTTHFSRSHVSRSSRMGEGGHFSRDSSTSSGDSTPRTGGAAISGGGSSTALSLRELNDRLENYIRNMQLIPETNIHTINRVTERSGSSVDISSMQEYQEYEKLLAEYLREEKEISYIEADIKEYQHKNGYWLKCNEEVDEQLREMERLIAEKKENIRILEEKVRDIEAQKSRLEQEKKERERQLQELWTRVDKVPSGWKDKIATLEMNKVRASINEENKTFMERVSRLTYDETTTTEEVDIAALRKQIAAEYDKRLKEELKNLQRLYTSHITGVKLSISELYKVKKSELDKIIIGLSGASRAEVDRILDEISRAKQEIIRLEEEKLKLTQKERELGEKLEEDRVTHEAMIKAKKEELAFLEGEYKGLHMEYKRFETERADYGSEVKRYESIIRPAEARIKVHAEPFLDGAPKSPSPPPSDDESSSSSSSSDGGGLGGGLGSSGAPRNRMPQDL